MRVRHILAGALVLCSGFALSAQDFGDEREALARAKAQSIVAETRADALETLAATQLSEAEAARSRAAAVASRIQAAEADIEAAEARITLIEALRRDQRARLAAAQEPAVRLMAALQTLARRPPALALVQPGSIEDLVHVRAVLAGLIPRLRTQTRALRAEIERGKALRADAGQALVALKAGQGRLAERRNDLLKLFAARRAVAQRTTGTALAEQDRAIALSEKARDISDLIGQLTRDGAQRDRLAALDGPVLRPSEGADESASAPTPASSEQTLPYRLPVAGRVMTGLGEVSEGGVRSRGLTLETRANAQIIAPSAGRVAFAGAYGSYGNIVIIDHGRGWTSLITSIAALDVSVGDNLVQGSPIGRTGDERPTLMVELRRNNAPVDITQLVR